MAEPSLGQAIGYSAKPLDRTVTVLNELDKQRQADENIFKQAQANLRANQQRIDKHKGEIDKFVISTDKGIPLVDQPEMKARAAELYNMVQDEIKEGRDPSNSMDIRNKQYEMKQAADRSQQSLKRFTADLAIANNPAYQNKVEFNPEYLKAYQTGDHDSWTKLTGTDYYAGGALKFKTPPIDWRKDAYTNTQRIGAVVSSSGQKEVPQQAKDSGFKDWASTPAYQDALLEQQVDGTPSEQAARNVKDFYYRNFDFKAAPDVSTGGGTGSKEKYIFSDPIERKSKMSGGTEEIIRQVTIGKKGGGSLPADYFTNTSEKTVLGKPTGLVNEFEKNMGGGIFLEVAVPDKKIEYPADWKDMSDKSKSDWLDEQYESDPNKFRIENIPLKSEFNKNKVEALGKTVDELFGGKPMAKKASGKKVLTKAELTKRAKDAGYTYDEYYDLVKDKVEIK